MRFSLISSFALLSAVCTSSPVPEDFSLEARAVPANLPFNIIYAFTAQLTLGAVPKTATTNPIPLLGGAGPSNGILVPSPIIKGIVSGPLLNATITNGFAIPGVYNTTAGVYQTPLTNAYGVTSDGAELYIYQSGVGPQVGQTTRIQMSIGGGDKYARLRDGFIVTANTPDDTDHTRITVKSYLLDTVA